MALSKLADNHIQAKNYTPISGARTIMYVVIHTAEVAEMGDSAENVARFFANQPKSTKGSSAHYCVDNNSTVSCVDESDVAWAAPGANHNGIHIEISGRAAQDLSQWEDNYSKATLYGQTDVLVADICRRNNIPVRHLTNDQLRAGQLKGLIGHVQASEVFKRSSHWDPGPKFPWNKFTASSKAELERITAKVQFFLGTGEGTIIHESGTVAPGGAEEAERLKKFYLHLANNEVQESIKHIRQDNDLKIGRRRV